MAGKAPERPYDDAYLKAYSDEHVFYEFDMFLWSSRLNASGGPIVAPSADDATRFTSALIEVFVVHLRNVIDFLYLERPQPTDVVAADFCAVGEWQAKIPSSLETARTRANKEIAHLTSARIAGSPPGKGWDFAGLSAQLQPVIRLFAIKALPSRLSPRVADIGK